jgi:hypothetical protein
VSVYETVKFAIDRFRDKANPLIKKRLEVVVRRPMFDPLENFSDFGAREMQKASGVRERITHPLDAIEVG